MEPSFYNAGGATALPATIAVANRGHYADPTATYNLSEPSLPFETAGSRPSKSRRRGPRPRWYLRTLIAATLRAKFCNISQRTAVKCVNRICDDPGSNAGAAGAEITLKQPTFSARFKNFMGDIEWPKKGAPVTPEYHEKLRQAVEAYGDGEEDLICRLTDLAAEIADSVIEEFSLKTKEKRKRTAAPASTTTATGQTPTDKAVTAKDNSFADETFTGVSNTVTSVPKFSDLRAGARVKQEAMEIEASNVAATLPVVNVCPAVPITTIQGTNPDTFLHQAAIPRPLPTNSNIAQPRPTAPVRNACATKPNAVGLVLQQEATQVPQVPSNVRSRDPRSVNVGAGSTVVPVLPQPATVNLSTNEQVTELEKRCKSIQQDALKLKNEESEIQKARDQLAAKEAKFLEKQRQLLAAKQAVAEQRKKAREMLQKELEQEEKILKDIEAKMAAWVQRVEAGKKRKREYEERLAALEYENGN